ncbi:hypothetical protein MRX96_010989 [Rhipicephalus microplus]
MQGESDEEDRSLRDPWLQHRPKHLLGGPVVALLIEGVAEAEPGFGAAMVGVAPRHLVDADVPRPILHPLGALSSALTPMTSGPKVQLFDIRRRRVGSNATPHCSLTHALGNVYKHVSRD